MQEPRTRWFGVAVAVVLGVAGCTSAAPGASAPPSAGASSTAAASESSAPVPTTYQTTRFAVPITFEAPGEWAVLSESDSLVDLGQMESTVAILSIAGTTVIDAQGAAHEWPTDVAAWLASEPSFGPPEAAAMKVGGLPATSFTVDVNYESGSRVERIIANSGVYWNFVANPERWRFIVVPTAPAEGLVLLTIGSSSDLASNGPLMDQLASSIAFPGMPAFNSHLFAVPLALTLVDGWVVEGDHDSDIDLQRGAQDAGILSISSTMVDSGGTRSPWPADLLGWLGSRPEFAVAASSELTIGGRSATLVDADATVPAGTRIELICSEPRHSCWLLDAPQSWRFVEIRDAGGSGIVVITNAVLGGLAEYASALDAVLATLEFR